MRLIDDFVYHSTRGVRVIKKKKRQEPPHIPKSSGHLEGYTRKSRQREFFVDNLLVRIHFIIVIIRWTGLAPWEFEFHFQAALHLPLLKPRTLHQGNYRGTSLIRNTPLLGPYGRTVPSVL